jgi:GT2 family glycosyltransferase
MSLSGETSVSVVIVGRSNYELTSKSVESVLTHTDKDVEVILVDNGSDSHVLENFF